MLIISPTISESMSSTKSGILHDKTSLNLEEIIMALTLTKLTNPFAELALKEIMEDVLLSSANQGNDFSRIIGRFSTKIQLSSRNVGEVIRARLLEKSSMHRTKYICPSILVIGLRNSDRQILFLISPRRLFRKFSTKKRPFRIAV